VTASILETKLHLPSSRAELVERPHLIDRLNNGTRSKLTLVSAPAGYGKTTLISQWSSLSDYPFAWLSLDENDNDLIRFTQYLASALQRIKPELAESTQEFLLRSKTSTTAALSPVELMTSLINDTVSSESQFVLVLDDYHTIHDKSIHGAVAFLLEHSHPDMHVVITTREDPPLALSRLRSQHEITEIREPDLRFDTNEIAQFFSDVMGFHVSRESIELMEQRTEGWIAGIQLAAFSLRERTDRDEFIRAFAGDHRYIMDFLSEEILSHQSDDVRHFLLTTAVLDRFCASACSAITDNNLAVAESQEILEYLEHANLLIVPLDDKRVWYRYHHLFSQALRHQLQLALPERIPEFHLRASRWFEENGHFLDAVQHALAAGAVSEMARLVNEHTHMMIYSGEMGALARWFAHLPKKVIHSSPWLSLTHAWLLLNSGDLHALKSVIRETEKSLDEAEHEDSQRIKWHLTTLKGMIALLTGDLEAAIELAGDAVINLPASDTPSRSHAQLLLGSSLAWSGDFAWAASVYSTSIVTSRAAGHINVTIDALGNRARLEVWKGQLRRAHQSCQEALLLTEEYHRKHGRYLPVTGYIYVRFSTILREWNKQEPALRYVREGIELYQQWGQRDFLVLSYANAARVLTAFGELREAQMIIDKAKLLAARISPWFEACISAAEARLLLARGNNREALQWLQNHQPIGNGQLRYHLMEFYIAYVRILIKTASDDNLHGHLEEAKELLERLQTLSEELGAMGYVLETNILQAMASFIEDKTETAQYHLKHALSIAEPEGYVRILIDEGEPMTVMLRQAAAAGIFPEYIGLLLKAFGRPTSKVSLSLPETLSARELEVLRLIAAGLANREIAEELVVSLGTIKTHINHIYQKLDVRSRTQAVARARELNLV
jgi:LuxR family maltose regulon positive regulatory protein